MKRLFHIVGYCLGLSSSTTLMVNRRFGHERAQLLMFQNKMPRYEILSKDAMATLDKGWKRIVSEIGIEFMSQRALDLFRKAGQHIEGNNNRTGILCESHLGLNWNPSGIPVDSQWNPSGSIPTARPRRTRFTTHHSPARGERPTSLA
jgi:hypothetical protein